MKNLNSLIVITITVGLVVIALGNPLILEGKSKKSRKRVSDVFVVNTALDPVPVTIQNSGSDEKLLITLVNGVTVAAGSPFEFGPVDVSEFNTLSLMARTSTREGATVELFFAAEPGLMSDPISKAHVLDCDIHHERGLFRCPPGQAPPPTVSVGGPFVVGRVTVSSGDAVVAVEAYLSK